MPQTIAAYPQFEQEVREFVDQYRRANHKKLRLAVYFAPPRRARRDIFVFEAIDGFGGDAADPDGKLFEFAYGSTPGFPLELGTSLRMVLTNPTELEAAAREGWKGIEEVRAARRAGRATVIYADAKGRRLWDLIK